MNGPLSIPVLGRCLDELVRRHEALRTVFAAEMGKPRQRILPPAPFPFPAVDLSGLPAAVREAEMARLEAADHNRSFDLARGPLFRATLLVAGPREHVGLFNMHHAIGDGWSWVSSLRRDDTGRGACELIFVRHVTAGLVSSTPGGSGQP